MTALAVAAASCAADDELLIPTPTVPVVTTTIAQGTSVDSASQSLMPEPSAANASPVDAQGQGIESQSGPVEPSVQSTAETEPVATEPVETAATGLATANTTAYTTIATTTIRPHGNIFDADIELSPVLNLDKPIDMAVPPGDDLVWIAEQAGRVSRVDLASGAVVETILDISDETRPTGEQGLLGIAATEQWLYVNFTDLEGDSRVDAFKRDGNRLGDARRRILLQAQPFSNHNGGDLAIGPDGLLYIAFGDGGSGGDPLNAGQDPSTWLGSILRIEPRPDSAANADAYLVPADNPFVADTSGERKPEIFLNGVRNPWRFSFDRHTGDLWIADVGQDRYEEVTLLLAANKGGLGANLGWRLREGLHSFSGQKPTANVDPVWQYDHDEGCSVTGGYVYRGSTIADLYGAYVFGDYCTARLWALQISSGEVEFRDLGVEIPGGRLVSFGEDANGELYTMSLDGTVARLHNKTDR